MRINEDHEETIINLGALQYDEKKMSIILGFDEKDICQAMKDEKSQFRKLYEKGKHMRDYAFDLKLFEMARGGDLKAMELFEKRNRIKS